MTRIMRLELQEILLIIESLEMRMARVEQDLANNDWGYSEKQIAKLKKEISEIRNLIIALRV